MPTIVKISKHSGIAGQVQFDAVIDYSAEGDTEPYRCSFVGYPASPANSPVVAISGAGTQVFVTDPSRFGQFGEQWIRSYFAD